MSYDDDSDSVEVTWERGVPQKGDTGFRNP